MSFKEWVKKHSGLNVVSSRYQHLCDEPKWIDFPPLLKDPKYRSPTLLILFWVYAYYTRLFTIPGRMIITVFLLVVPLSMISIRAPLQVLTLTLTTIFSIDLIVGFFFRPKIKIKRFLPKRARAGEKIRVEYIIKNQRRVPIWDIVLDSMQVKGIRYVNNTLPSIHLLAPNEAKKISSYIYARRRGVYKIPAPMSESAFPFSLLKWSYLDGEKEEIIIYPYFTPLTTLELPTGKRFQSNGLNSVAKVGESIDYVGNRDYRFGDDPRHIHWLSTARSGELIVRIFQEERLTRVAVILDTFVPKQPALHKFLGKQFLSLPFESAISLTASIFQFLAKGDLIVDLFAAGPEVYHFQEGRSLGHFENAMDILSCLEPNHKRPFVKLKPVVMKDVAGIGSAVVILLTWNKRRQKFIESLESHGVSVKVLLITDDTQKKYPAYVQPFSPADIFQGLVTKL